MAASSDSRRLLLDAFRAGLDAARGDRLVARALARRAPEHPVVLVAAGKAAGSMASGAADALGDRIERGLVVEPAQTRENWPFPCRVVHGEHPVPGAGSLAAGRALLDILEETPARARFLFLISGGASSLVEVPVAGVTPDDLVRANEWLLGSGLDIARVNAVRRRLSCIKGGGLARYLGDRGADVLALSDVPGNDPSVIGSGWLAPPRHPGMPPGLPGWLVALAERGRPGPSAADPVWRRVDIRVIGDNRTALDAAIGHLEGQGVAVRATGEQLAGEAAQQGGAIGRALVSAASGALVQGGECTVRLPESAGRGGRCQHLALAAAREIAGRDDCLLLAAGTDGRDGESDAAGALVDGGTVRRGEIEGLSAGESLAQADSGTFLEASGDLVDTGPTGTNVNDVVIGIKLGARVSEGD